MTPGNDRYIQWYAGTDWPGQFDSQCKLRITANDGTAPPAPSGMVYIPGGAFRMGDALNDGNTAEFPVHSVFISSFFMDRYLVTRELWLTVYTYALSAGYGFDNGGAFKAANHPAQTINWYDAVKWCNARSQRDGLTPYYYTDAGLTTVYQTGQIAPYVKTSASGYRLPTEAEWEKAARGGLSGLRFPWGNTISESQANYYGSTSSYSYDLGPNYYNSIGSIGGTSPATSPVGSFAANGYGLYDMAGNVLEWCWDCTTRTGMRNTRPQWTILAARLPARIVCCAAVSGTATRTSCDAPVGPTTAASRHRTPTTILAFVV